MRGDALGLIEVVGLAAACEAADAAVKTANVELLGFEPSGQGMVTIKLTGDVGAVTAAVEAACAAGSRLSRVHASRVIARPDSAVTQEFLP
ncbi:MAG: BMC domain-containing protein [Firmicutes bacterium]|nr:BMC domain-containing protein [Bacillota bacterium]